MLACTCGGILEVGLFVIVAAVSAFITRVVNWRRRQHIYTQIAQLAKQSNQELAA